jgi:retron-type reverse transcriptase
VYKRKNLERAWESVRRNQGAGGIDGQSIAAFEERQQEHLERLTKELRDETYQPAPAKQVQIPQRGGKSGEKRELGIPTVYDRVC